MYRISSNFIVQPSTAQPSTAQSSRAQSSTHPNSMSAPRLNNASKLKDIIVAANTIAVILPGDSPDATGTDQPFTDIHAMQLGKRILFQELNKRSITPIHIIVTNGPRTGKYTSKGPLRAHSTRSVDPVTQSFINELSQHSLVKTTPLDFSAYKPLLEAFVEADQKGTFYVAGESTDIVSKVSKKLPGHTIIIESESMSEKHIDDAKNTVRSGLAQGFLRRSGKLELPASPAR